MPVYAPDLLADLFDHVRHGVQGAVADLTPDQAAWRPAGSGNSVAWLIWHLTRVQDDHVAEVAGTEQVWTADGWYERFGLPFDRAATGYGQTSDDVAAVRVDPVGLLAEYYEAVHTQTTAYVTGLEAADLDQVIDRRWDPPVTLGIRLTSVVNDDLQHVGQAAYVRGLNR